MILNLSMFLKKPHLRQFTDQGDLTGLLSLPLKKGKAGQDQFNFSYSTGFQDVPKRIKMNNRDQEVTWWKENSAQLWKNVGGDPAVPNGSRIYNGFIFYDELSLLI